MHRRRGVRFENRSKTITVGHLCATVHGLSGYDYPDGDSEFDDESAARFVAVQDELVLKFRADTAPATKTK